MGSRQLGKGKEMFTDTAPRGSCRGGGCPCSLVSLSSGVHCRLQLGRGSLGLQDAPCAPGGPRAFLSCQNLGVQDLMSTTQRGQELFLAVLQALKPILRARPDPGKHWQGSSGPTQQRCRDLCCQEHTAVPGSWVGVPSLGWGCHSQATDVWLWCCPRGSLSSAEELGGSVMPRSTWDQHRAPVSPTGKSTGISEERSGDEEEEGRGRKAPEEQSCWSALP